MKNYKKFNKLWFTFNFFELVAKIIDKTNNRFFETTKFFCYLQKLPPSFRIEEKNDSSICIMYILHNLEKETNKLRVQNPDKIVHWVLRKKRNIETSIKNNPLKQFIFFNFLDLEKIYSNIWIKFTKIIIIIIKYLMA